MRFYAEKTSGILSLMFVFAWKMWYRIGQQEVITLAATLTNRERTFAMAARELPSPELLRKMLRYEPETGLLFWLPREREFFASDINFKSWNTKYSGKEALNSKGSHGYKQGAVFKIPLRAHRVIWALQTGEWPPEMIDHADRDRSNNKWENLRAASRSENGVNRNFQSRGLSKYLGVTWNRRRKKWNAIIAKNKVTHQLGRFDSEIEAAEAYDAAAIILHGKFANLNFPERKNCD